MKIILSGTEYDCLIREYEEEALEKEVMVYFKQAEKIILLNQTGSIVWKQLKEHSKNDSMLIDTEIVKEILDFFHLPEEMKETVERDVRLLIDNFIKQTFITLMQIGIDDEVM